MLCLKGRGMSDSVIRGTLAAAIVAAAVAIFAIVAPSAANAANGQDDCPNAAIRAHQGVTHLPDCRAIEMVSPTGRGAEVRLNSSLSTEDGNMVCFNSEYSVADAPPSGAKTHDDGYCARRTADGWETKWMTGPVPPDPRRGVNGSGIRFLSKDGQRVVFISDVGIGEDWKGGQPGHPLWGAFGLFLREAGTTRWLSETPPDQRLRDLACGFCVISQSTRLVLGVSEDGRHGIFISTLKLLPEDTNSKPDVYEWTPQGLRLVSVDEDGKAVSGFVPSKDTFDQRIAMPGSVSPDGSRVFFLAPAFRPSVGDPATLPLPGAPPDVVSVFMRENGQTRLISPRLGPGPDKDVLMEGAYADSSIVYMSTQQQLTDEEKESCATCDAIYRYDVETDELSLFIDHPDGVAFLGASEDGETVVYRTLSAASQLIVRHDGQDHLIGTLTPLDTVYLYDVVASTRPDKRGLRVSSDGSVVVFASFGGFDGAPIMNRQVFRWSSEDGVEWISKRQDGGPVANFAQLGNFSTPVPGLPRVAVGDQYFQGANIGRVIAEGGERIYFETQEALVEEDVNGRIDVYEWRDGEVRLVTPGTQDDDAYYFDNSPDGKTVFFATGSRVIPELDRTHFRELYASRVNGGFELPETPQECKGDACRGAAAKPPARPAVGSTAFDGDGNVKEPRSARLRVSGPRSTTGSAVLLRLRVSDAGQVKARGAAVRATAKRVAKGGAHDLRIRLKPRQSRALRAKGRLRAKVTVTFRSASGQTVSRTVAVTFKQPKQKRIGGGK